MNEMFWHRFIKWQVRVMLILMSLVVVACGQKETNTATLTATIPSTSEVVIPTSTVPSASELAIFFPQLKPVEGTRETMTADLTGQLVLFDNCLRVIADYSGTNYLLVWPSEFMLNVEGEVVQILDGTGQVVARVGDQIWTGGGEVPESFVREENRGTCPGPYFEVGEGFGNATPIPADEAD
jgi:hypothetical protein